MINLSKDLDKKLTFKLFKIKRPKGMEQNRITPQRKMIEIIIKIVIVYNYQYVILFFLRWWSIKEDGSMLENNNKIKIDQKEICLVYSWFYGENVGSWVILWGEMFPSVSEMCFKKNNIMVYVYKVVYC